MGSERYEAIEEPCPRCGKMHAQGPYVQRPDLRKPESKGMADIVGYEMNLDRKTIDQLITDTSVTARIRVVNKGPIHLMARFQAIPEIQITTWCCGMLYIFDANAHDVALDCYSLDPGDAPHAIMFRSCRYETRDDPPAELVQCWRETLAGLRAWIEWSEVSLNDMCYQAKMAAIEAHKRVRHFPAKSL